MADEKKDKWANWKAAFNPGSAVKRRMAEVDEPDKSKGTDKGDLPGPGFNFFNDNYDDKRGKEFRDKGKFKK